MRTGRWEGVTATPFDGGPVGAKVDLALTFQDRADAAQASPIDLRIDYDHRLFDGGRIERMLRQVVVLAEVATTAPSTPIGQLTLLDGEERVLVTERFARNPAQFDVGCNLVELFDVQVSRDGASLAVIGQGGALTYSELDQAANAVAAELRDNFGVGPDDRVGIAMRRSELLIVAIVGILKAGAAYVPVDPLGPEERTRDLLAAADCRALISDDSGDPHGYWHFEDRWLSLTEAPKPLARRLDATIGPNTLAYVIFTSGSTGRPKGVMVEHRSVVNLVRGLEQQIYARYDGTQDVALMASQVFDASVQQIFAALLGGHRLHIVSDDERHNGRDLLRLLADRRITVADATPSLLTLLLQWKLDDAEDLALRHLIVGGEAFGGATASRLMQSPTLSGVAITNVYGPTECTVDCTFHHVTPEDMALETVPIGRPMPNAEVLLLDAAGNPVPIGVPGHLCVGGPGLARSYLGDTDLTAQAFVPHPLRSGERVYRTGDYAAWREDGVLLFLGRGDDQFKIRGHRVEWGEIDAALQRADGILQAAAVVDGRPPNETVAAFVVGSDAEPDLKALRADIAQRLPSYMVPARFIRMDTLPRTTSGKVDRRVLAATLAEAQEPSARMQLPATELVLTLADLWQQVLGRPVADVNEDFFEAGGHSLAAARLLGRLHEALGVEVRLRDFFDEATIAGLARFIETAPDSPYQSMKSAVPAEHYPLSPAQQRLWMIDQLHGSSLAYAMPAAYRIEGALDVAALRRACQALVERHDALRTRVVRIGGEPYQHYPHSCVVDFAFEDLADKSDLDAAARCAEEVARPFDLETGGVATGATVRPWAGSVRPAREPAPHHR